MQTKVKALMTPHPVLISPESTLQQAAQKMEEINCGVLPVGTEDNVEGIITDRDIVIRAIARGENPKKEKVGDYMTEKAYSCKENDTLQQAADLMRKHQVSRLIVKDANGKVSGILSFGCILRKDGNAGEIADVIQHATGRKAA